MTQHNTSFFLPFSKHARKRMSQRGISEDNVNTVLAHGRETITRDAFLYFVGRKEIAFLKKKNIDLHDCQGIHVVISMQGEVQTVYRNEQPNLIDRRKRRAKRIQRRY